MIPLLALVNEMLTRKLMVLIDFTQSLASRNALKAMFLAFSNRILFYVFQCHSNVVKVEKMVQVLEIYFPPYLTSTF
jgi:hypothetical protein